MKYYSLFAALLTLFIFKAKAQNPDYLITIKNENLSSPNVLEFDLYIKSVGNNAFEYASFQAGINISPKFVNGGTLTIDTINGGSEFHSSKQAPVINKPSSSWDATNNRIKIIAQQPPGSGNGKIISASGDGNRIARFKITNTVNFDTVLPSLSFNFGAAITWTTKIYAYVNGVSTEITDQSKIVSNSTTTVLQEPSNIGNSFKINDVQINSIQLQVNEKQNAQNILVLINKYHTPNYSLLDGEQFSANQSYSDAQILSDSSRVIYEGNSAGTIDIAGLEENTKYYFAGYLFNGSDANKNILLSKNFSADTTTKISTINNPKIATIFPTTGNIFDTILVRGSKLFPYDSVYFGKTKVNVIEHAGDSVLSIVIPEGELSNLVKVYTSYGSANSPSYFTILPSIKLIDSNPLAIGQNVTVEGLNFEGVDSLTIGNVSQDIIESNDHSITFKLSYYNMDEIVKIYCKNGFVASSQKIRFKPTVFDVSPKIGTTNDPIQIKGRNLYNIDSVMVGNVKANITGVYPDSLITISIPNMAVKSVITVYTKNGIAVSIDSLNVISGIETVYNSNQIMSYFDFNNNLIISSKDKNTSIQQAFVYDIKGQLIYQSKEELHGQSEMSIAQEELVNTNFIVLITKTSKGISINKLIK
jgi:hypothetical protein